MTNYRDAFECFLLKTCQSNRQWRIVTFVPWTKKTKWHFFRNFSRPLAIFTKVKSSKKKFDPSHPLSFPKPLPTSPDFLPGSCMNSRNYNAEISSFDGCPIVGHVRMSCRCRTGHWCYALGPGIGNLIEGRVARCAS